MEQFKPNKNTMYWAWGSPDGRVKRHLVIMTWDKRAKAFRSYKIWVSKADSLNTKSVIFMTWQGQSTTDKNLTEASYMQLHKYY